MAPELIEQKSFNHKADIWSCGIIAYILLYSMPPFKGDNDEKIREKIKTSSMNVPMDDDYWKDATEGCRAFVKKLLAHNPDDRPNARDLLNPDPAIGDKWLRDNAIVE